MTEHIHSAPFDGSGEDDVCSCGQILCPDTGTPVGYASEGPGPSYWHLDGTTCFLHQVVWEGTGMIVDDSVDNSSPGLIR